MNALDNFIWMLRGKASAALASSTWIDESARVDNKTDTNHNFDNVINNAGNLAWKWGGAIIAILGALMIVFAIVKIFKKLAFEGSPEQGQPPKWSTIILLFVVGGACLVGGITLFAKLGAAGGRSLDAVGTQGTAK